MPGPLLVVDGPFLLYRSFFAMPDSITGVDDHPVGALLGACNVLLRVAADRSPRAIVVCFGAEAATYRPQLYAGYHAHRPPTPDALQWQFDYAPRLVDGFGWGYVTSEDFEADDLLGAYADVEAEAGGQTLILTGDRDMFQCATPETSVLLLKPGKAGFEDVDPDGVLAKYGIAPVLVPDFIALRGDPSDGIPGAPGIGEKTAAELLRRHGSLEALLAAVGTEAEPKTASGERPRIAAILREHADMLRAYKEIATLQPIAVVRPEDRATDLAGGRVAAEALGLGALSRRLADAGSLADL
jgi:5'-3' exonuclease